MARKALLNSCRQKKEDLLQALRAGKKPRFSTRVYNRCHLCGRNHGYLGFFGICRICFRERAVKGEIPGVTKSSW